MGEHAAKSMSRGRPVSRIYKEHIKVNMERTKPLELKEELSKVQMQMANKQFLKCSISLTARETQIKTSLRFHLTLVGVTFIRKQITANSCKNVGNGEPLDSLDELVNQYSHYGENFAHFSKCYKSVLHTINIYHSKHRPKGFNSPIIKDTCISIFIATY